MFAGAAAATRMLNIYLTFFATYCFFVRIALLPLAYYNSSKIR